MTLQPWSPTSNRLDNFIFRVGADLVGAEFFSAGGEAAMTAEQDPTISYVLEMWRGAFGEPPAILVDPAQMLVLLEAHLSHQRPDPSQESRA